MGRLQHQRERSIDEHVIDRGEVPLHSLLVEVSAQDAPDHVEQVAEELPRLPEVPHVTAPGFSPQPQLLAPLRVLSVERAEGGGFSVTAEWQQVKEAEDAPLREPVNVDLHQDPGEPGSTLILHTANPPVLATGFQGSVVAAASHPLCLCRRQSRQERMPWECASAD